MQLHDKNESIIEKEYYDAKILTRGAKSPNAGQYPHPQCKTHFIKTNS
jgi:hypothetical protein